MSDSAKTSTGLAGYLRELGPRKLRLAPFHQDLTPREIRRATKKLERLLGDISPKKPEPYDLSITWDTLSEVWESKKKLENVGRRHIKRAPWVLFFPQNEQELWLGADIAFTLAYRSWLGKNPRASSIAALIHVFLRDYPKDLPTFDMWREGLRNLINQVDSIRLTAWRDRCKKYFFLESDGCARFAGAWLASNTDSSQILSEAGLTGELSRSNFIADVHDRFMRHVSNLLRSDKMELSVLERVFAFITEESGQLRFPEKSREIANHLLLPLANENPSPEIQDRIRAFLLSHLGDPRITPDSWQGVAWSAREVMLRWLVGVALEDFFRLLDATALDRHWRYRKAFWSAYLERDRITDAWVILGSRVRDVAWASLSEGAEHYAGFRKRSGVQSNHSVLLLKVGPLTVSEWSHDGSCRVWLSDNQNAPRFYQRWYTKSNLVKGADYVQRHHGAVNGRWQSQLHTWIREQTGIHLMMIDYMPRPSI